MKSERIWVIASRPKTLVIGTLSYSQSSATIAIASEKWNCSMFSMKRVTYSPGSVMVVTGVVVTLPV